MPKKGRRTERDDALGADPGGFGGDQDYDWIKYLGEGRSPAASSSPSTSSGVVALRTEAPPAALPPARPVAPSRPYERDPGLLSGGDTDPRGGAPVERGGRAQRQGRRALAGPAPDGARIGGGATREIARSAAPADDWPVRGDRGSNGDGTGPMRSAGRGRRAAADRSGGADQRGGTSTGQTSREDTGGRRTQGTRQGRAVKVRPGSATDLLFNPAADEYGQPLYAPPQDPGRPRGGSRADDPFTSPHGRLDTSEYARPLYPSYDSGPATDARPRPAWPDDDPLGDTDPRGRPASAPASGRPSGRTGPQRQITGSADFDTRSRPQRPDRTGPQRRIDGLTRPDPLTDSGIGVLWSPEEAPALPARSAPAAPQTAIANAPPRRASTGPLDRLALAAPKPADIAAPATAPPGTPVRTTRKGGGQKARKRKSASSPATQSAKSRQRAGRGGKVAAMLVCGLVVVAAAAAYGYFKLMPRTSHTVTTPAAIGAFTRQPANTMATGLKQRILTAGSGNVKNVVAAVYQQKKGPGTSKGLQIVVFIGGNLTGNASAGDLISAYMARLHKSFTAKPGGLGGQAACAPGSNGSPAECAWADGDTFGVLVSATLTAQGLADEMLQMRPAVEHVIK